MFAQTITLAPPLRQKRAAPPTGFARGTMIRTITGPRPVERIMAGDLLLDCTGQIVELRQVTTRRAFARDLVEIHPSAMGLGLAPGRLDRALRLARGTAVALRDWRSELLYGGTALTPAANLVDGLHVTRPKTGAMLYDLRCDSAVVVQADGLSVRLPALDA